MCVVLCVGYAVAHANLRTQLTREDTEEFKKREERAEILAKEVESGSKVSVACLSCYGILLIRTNLLWWKMLAQRKNCEALEQNPHC